jgi:glutamate---cysteine ligase / carboxylate-amine ligase
VIGERPAYTLFSRFGLELEYMLVANESLDVRAVVDELFRRATGELASDVERGDITWSNELVAHVVELKTTDPAPQLSGLAAKFHRQVTEINTLAGELGARLMPTAMHPWMQPRAETRLWPHDNSEVYQAFDRVFQCQGHGWANLQSTHLNLPFANDAEFGRLHAATRLVLPLLPALAASSPICEGQAAGLLDARLDAYRHNARRIPSVTGAVVPEAVFTPAAYRAEILEPLYADIRPHDPGGVLQHEWLNARGAIARFERNTIEIRVLDVQEHPAADLAIAVLVVAVLEALVASNKPPPSRWPRCSE